LIKDKLSISDDHSLAFVTLAKKAFTAKELEQLIDRLGDLRAQLQPAVPMEAPKLRDNDYAMSVSRFDVNASVDTGQTLIQLRHLGFGWTTYALSRAGAQLLAEGLTNLHRAVDASAVIDPHSKKH